MAESPNWEVVWEDRIIKKIDVNNLIGEEDLRKYLEKTLEDGHDIRTPKQKRSHFVNTKKTLLKHIHKAIGYSETDDIVKAEPFEIPIVEKRLTKRFSKDVADERKGIIKDEAREKIPDIRKAGTVEEMKGILMSVPSFARKQLRSETKFRIRFLIRRGRLPSGTVLK